VIDAFWQSAATTSISIWQVCRTRASKISTAFAFDRYAHHVKTPEDIFGQSVDCVIFGQTHHPYFDVLHGVPFINPGSATDQDHSGSAGTIAVLDINGRLKSVNFVQL
jgi:predicted phosphodiesterase